jgi:4-hydroxybenzoate polyprenyltransferase
VVGNLTVVGTRTERITDTDRTRPHGGIRWSILLAMGADRDGDGREDGDVVVDADDARLSDHELDEEPGDAPGDDVEDGAYDEGDETDDAVVEQREIDPPGFFGRVRWTPVLLVQAAHAKQAIVTALVMGGVAVLTGRPAEEAGVVLLTVLVGQTILGWHNDIVDKARDETHRTPGKPIADGRLDPGTAWYAITVAALVLVPLSITTGITAGAIYLVSVCVGMLGNVVLRTGFFSWVTWAISFALLPAYLSYGGWGGQAVGEPPEPAITILAALLGVGVHFMRAVWGLVADHEDGWTYLPLKLGLKLGATRLLALSTFVTVGIAVAIGIVGYNVGLSQ